MPGDFRDAAASHGFAFWESVETELHELGISNNEARGAVRRLLFFGLLIAVFTVASCHKAPASTAVTCTTSTSTSSTSTSTSTCTDPVTSISVTISPATVSVNVVGKQQFQASIQGGTNSVTIWKVNNMTGGNSMVGQIDSNGLYNAPPSVPSPATVSVTAVSFEDQNVSAASMVTITPAPVVTITSPSPPVTVTAGTANTITFSANETGGTTNTILWYVGPVGGVGVLGGNATLGTISAAGVYSPPVTPPIGQMVVVTAAAEDAPTSTATLAVTIAGYSTSSLQGQFAFSIAGSNSSGRFFRAGSFAADGLGRLSGVLEDTNTSSGATTTPISTTGTYTVSMDGRGTLQFNDGLMPASFNFVFVSGSQLQIIGFDATGTAAGQARAQDVSTFVGAPLSALSGTYIFDFAGVHGSNGLSQIGEVTSDGAGNITQAVMDINDGGTLASPTIFGSKTVCTPPPMTTPTPPPPSSYSVGSNGRGTLTLNSYDPTTCNAGVSYTLNFYVVSRGAAEFVGTDPVLQVAGYTSRQAPNAAFSNSILNGNFAFLLAGSKSGGPIATAGSFLADGNGNVTSGALDENVNGTPSPDVAFVPNGSYSVTPNGRGTLTFATASRTYAFVFYLGAIGTNATAVLQETDSGIVSDGNIALQQSTVFALASIKGNYAMETSGTSGASAQDIAGELAADGAGAITAGKIDINTGGILTVGQAVTGSYSAPATNGRATLALNSSTPNYAAYVVSPTQIYLIGIQSSQLAAGELLRQF